MRLERFNHYGKFIEFDSQHGTVAEVDSSTSGATVGVGDLINGIGVAIAVVGGAAELHLGTETFILGQPDLFLDYEHNDDGRTSFTARQGLKKTKITYVSWWRCANPGGVAFGAPADEDKDFCAYAKFMGQSRERLNHLVRKYRPLPQP